MTTNSSYRSGVTVPILGMHRSGTSMFTRALNLLGLDLGQPLLPPQPDNPRGFWENEFFYALDIRLLQALECHPSGYGVDSDLDTIPGRSTAVFLSVDELATMETYLAREFADATTWGWKDPRSVLVFPFWLNSLVRLGCSDIRPVIIIRHPTPCVRSLLKRTDLDSLAGDIGVSTESLALDIWKSYHRILTSIADETGCIISFHEWFLDPHRCESELNRAADYCGLPTENLSDAVAWIDPAAVSCPADDRSDDVDAEAQLLYWELVARAERQKSDWADTLTLAAPAG